MAKIWNFHKHDDSKAYICSKPWQKEGGFKNSNFNEKSFMDSSLMILKRM